MGAIPATQRRMDVMHFRALPPGLEIQELVGIRSLRTTSAVTTPLPARERWFSTTGIPIRPLVRQRFCSTQPAQTTLLLEPTLWCLTTQAPTIRLSVRIRCLTTLTDSTI